MRVRELKLTYHPRSDLPPLSDAAANTPRLIVPLLTSYIADEAVEVFTLVCLSSKHKVLGIHTVSRGSLDTAIVHPRDVFKVAILANAAAIVLAHNHPSGDPTPSLDDTALTKRLVEAGEIIGIDVVDHIIIGHEGRYWSMLEAGGLHG